MPSIIDMNDLADLLWNSLASKNANPDQLYNKCLSIVEIHNWTGSELTGQIEKRLLCSK